jgi:hypothetical protein
MPERNYLVDTKNPKRRKRPKVPDTQARVRAMLQEAVSFARSNLSGDREKAIRYYKGEPFGNEEDGRSKVVITEVRDALLSQMPSLMRVFFGPDGAVEFESEDADLAKQVTEYLRVLFEEDNDGFNVAHSWIEDGLKLRLGVLKLWWEKMEEVEVKPIEGVTQEEYDALVKVSSQEGIEVDNVQQAEDGSYSMTLSKNIDKGRLRIEPIPVEEFIWNRRARGKRDAMLMAHVSNRTVSELIGMGIDEEVVTSAVGTSITLSAEEKARNPQRTQTDDTFDLENSEVPYCEAYFRMDFGRGIELRKVCTVGGDFKIVNEEPVEEFPFVFAIPMPQAHEFEGLSDYDLAGDLQLINSNVVRGMLDSLNMTLNPRIGFVEGMASVADLKNVEIGALIRMTDPNAVKPIEHDFVGRSGIEFLSYFDRIREDRLGQTRASTGLDPKALQSTERAAVEFTAGKSQERLELMARFLAEGFKDMYRLMYKLVVRHQSEMRKVRLSAGYTEIDPSRWPKDMDLRVRVGLGAGTKSEQIASLQATIARMEAVIQMMGPQNPLTSIKHLSDAYSEEVKLTGRQNPRKYWNEITAEDLELMAQQAQQQPPEQDPALLLAQAEVENTALKNQIEEGKVLADSEYKREQLALQREQMMLQDDRERDKLDADIMLRAKEIGLKYQVQVDVAEIRAQAQREQEEMRGHTQMTTAIMNAPVEEPVGGEAAQG